jgi:excisionase family DNA binding protein
MSALEARLLTVPEAAVYLGMTEKALRQAMYRRAIPFVKNGRAVRLDRLQLDRMIDDRTVQAVS